MEGLYFHGEHYLSQFHQKYRNISKEILKKKK